LWHYPTDPDLQGPLERILGALDATGFDPFVGRKLYHFAHSAGLTDLHVAVDPYHLIAGTVDAATLRQWYLNLISPDEPRSPPGKSQPRSTPYETAFCTTFSARTR
jgi:hypothetical protein